MKKTSLITFCEGPIECTSVGGRETERVKNAFKRFCELIGNPEFSYLESFLVQINCQPKDHLGDAILEVSWRSFDHMMFYKKLIQQAWRQMGGRGTFNHYCAGLPHGTCIGESDTILWPDD